MATFPSDTFAEKVLITLTSKVIPNSPFYIDVELHACYVGKFNDKCHSYH
jgi:uncharacterized protein (DUF2461 family)